MKNTITVHKTKTPQRATIDRQYYKAHESQALYCLVPSTKHSGVNDWYICSPDGEPNYRVKKSVIFEEE